MSTNQRQSLLSESIRNQRYIRRAMKNPNIPTYQRYVLQSKLNSYLNQELLIRGGLI